MGPRPDIQRIDCILSFRRGDLVDFSLGLVRFGLSRELIAEVGAWLIRHPLNPAPMFKW
jgi:hypothetical protein